MSPFAASASSSDSENGERLRGFSFFSFGARALPLPLPLRSISLASLASLSLSLPLLCRAFFDLLDGAARYSSSSLPFAELGAMLASLSLTSLAPASAGAAASAWLLAAGAAPSPEIASSSESPSAALVADRASTGEGLSARLRCSGFLRFFCFAEAVAEADGADGLGADAFAWAALFRRLLRAPGTTASVSDTTRSSRSSSTGAAARF